MFPPDACCSLPTDAARRLMSSANRCCPPNIVVRRMLAARGNPCTVLSVLCSLSSIMATRHQYECCPDIGLFSMLTNAYCLVTNEASENFYSVFESKLAGDIPMVKTSLANTRIIIGLLCAGNKNGLLVPQHTNDQEIHHLRNTLPDKVVVQRIDVGPFDLGRCISCNDYTALMHPNLERGTEELIADVLEVDVFRRTVKGEDYVGDFCAFNNKGGMVPRHTSPGELHGLSTLLEVPLVAGTVNKRRRAISAGLIVNDWTAFCGSDTTTTELSVIESVFKLRKAQPSMIVS
ncbi:Eukaryotic translation initiation factor 6-2 [Platanthera guangdongensis]|uniref:Eukaryotic translation initiation factor 6 n=1 Tax=Platanthera guangdongensis TaxID=2320717 RepID=A0ABR2MKE2_9ASPA